MKRAVLNGGQIPLRSHQPGLRLALQHAEKGHRGSIPNGSFDAAIAARGRVVFDRTCASCHIGGGGTDNNSGKMHAAAETGVDDAYAARTRNKAYRTTPLRALWQHAPYFHDGSAATLAAVVAQYNRVRSLGLTPDQQRDLIEFLKSL